MNISRVKHIAVVAIIAAYLVPAILSARNLPGQALIFELHSSLSVQNGRGSDLDARPYWASHRHLMSSERFLSDHIPAASKPLMSVIIPERTVETQAAVSPLAHTLSPQSALRAPPLS